MKLSVRRSFPLAFGLVALLLLGSPSSSFAQGQAEASSGHQQLAQYCTPHDEDEDPDAARIYC